MTPAVRREKALLRFAVSITVLNVLGHLFLGFEQSPITPIATVLTAYGVALVLEYVDSRAYDRAPEYAGGPRAVLMFLLPAHIAALACAMLLWGSSVLWPYLLATTVAVASKYIVRLRLDGRLRHVLNPSNTGIVVVLLLFPWVGIAPPYHFTNATTGAIDWLLPLAILGLGTMLNAKLTGKIPLISGWLAGFVIQAVVRWLLLDHSLIAALLPATGLAFILFTNYMITDPGSTPVRPAAQVGFGLTTAAVYGLLVVNGVVFGLFFALVATCLLRAVVLWSSSRMPAVRRRTSDPATVGATV
ncbi:hypothetical protein FVA95_23695 [Pseudonocardia sp. EV170527-09]|nr:hypothetical protein FVA95_23695 [Pseudonocardia sp. EV170527-09]